MSRPSIKSAVKTAAAEVALGGLAAQKGAQNGRSSGRLWENNEKQFIGYRRAFGLATISPVASGVKVPLTGYAVHGPGWSGPGPFGPCNGNPQSTPSSSAAGSRPMETPFAR